VFEEPRDAVNTLGNELAPRALPLSPKAREAWIAFHNEIESDVIGGARSDELRDVAGKAAEQAARIAAVLTIVDNPIAKAIGVDALTGGCELARWYLGEARRLIGEYFIPQEVADAEALLKWIHANGHEKVGAGLLQKSGPRSVRSKERLYPAIEALINAGTIEPDKTTGKARAWTIVQPSSSKGTR
jgi:Protein of unknown function (DUF3987)